MSTAYIILIISFIVGLYLFQRRGLGMKKAIDGDSVFTFWDSTQCYPSWIQHNSEYVWPLVLEATKNIKSHGLEIKLKDSSIFNIFQKEITNWKGEDCLDIELYYNKKIVSAFRVVNRFYGNGEYYILSHVEFIKSGEWKNKIYSFTKWKVKNARVMEQRMNDDFETYRKNKMNKRLE